MQTETVAACLESLGNPTRLTLYRELVKAGGSGLAVGELQTRLAIPASTLSHHVAHLVRTELVSQEREGRVLRCRARFNTMQAVLQFLLEECCAEENGACC